MQKGSFLSSALSILLISSSATAVNTAVLFAAVPNLWARADVEICTDGSDNDSDGLIDCSDGDCDRSPICHDLPIIGKNLSDQSIVRVETGSFVRVNQDIDGQKNDAQIHVVENQQVDIHENGIQNVAIDSSDYQGLSPEEVRELVRQEVEKLDVRQPPTLAQDSPPTLSVTNPPAPVSQVHTIETIVREVETVEVPVEVPVNVYAEVTAVGEQGEKEKDCVNGIDDDRNGSMDCADWNCASHPSCIFVPFHVAPTANMSGDDQ